LNFGLIIYLNKLVLGKNSCNTWKSVAKRIIQA